MAKNAVLTGATGHIGYHVARRLVAGGYRLTLLCRRSTKETDELVADGANLVICDLFAPATYAHALAGQDVLFHLAAENTTDLSDEARVIKASLGMTEAVVGAALAAGISTIVYTSSVVVLGRSPEKTHLLNENDRVAAPESPYVKGKLLAEQWVEGKIATGADIRRVYPSWVVGSGDPRQTPPHKFIKDFAAKGTPIYFEGGISVVHVEDVATAHVAAYERGARAGQYVLSGQNVTFEDFYKALGQQFRQKAPTIKVPKWIVKTGAVVAQALLGDGTPVTPAYVESVIGRYSWYDNSRARNELGFTPRPLSDTLAEVAPEIRRRLNGTLRLRYRHTPAPAMPYADDDVLLITGFPGWLGNRMVDVFMNGDTLGRNKIQRRIRLLVQPGAPLPKLPSNFEIAEGDLTDKASLLRATQGVKAVYHLAGVIYPPKLEMFETINRQGTINLADACVANGVKRVLYMSTDSTSGYTNPPDLFTENTPPNPYKNYGKSKLAGEEYLLELTRQGQLQATSLRGFWFFGPNVPERNLGFLKSFNWPRQPVFGNGRNLRSISHTDDLINAFVLAEQSTASIGKWYWLPTFATPQTVDDIYYMIGEGLGKKTNLLHIPNLLCDVADVADNLLTRFGILNATLLAAGKFHKQIATQGHDAATRDFGWEPRVTKAQIQAEVAESLANA